MGRHRRSAPLPRSERRKQGAARTGLLSASAALTIGAVAIGTGVLPTPDGRFDPVDTDIQAQEEHTPAGSPSAEEERAERAAGRGEQREREEAAEESPEDEPAEEESPEPDAAEDETAPEPAETSAEPAPSAESPDSDAAAPSSPSPPPPSSTTPGTPHQPSPSQDPAQEASAEVLRLVNQERAQAGCSPLTHDGPLQRLALSHSRDMAERDYFSHDTPDGQSPWDRADAAGVGNLGGENIARGQQSAQDVMNSWMNSEGHRANILNCDFTTLGTGVHLGPGGPWWTQNFGY